ncbi:hypothetical protein HNR23_004262 [Nocardiopsis mwathae]|uniref:Uncharacterized protein n=1 Tax=Nocardiopsis mwathae TaxID=1472723 RepID=A0A7W9YLC3_9ACTN|nr:hypothetical protein [Nocardiopsis mwathae]MBB6174202.1 hypothetical protein [Nocardiopsis mwathae]
MKTVDMTEAEARDYVASIAEHLPSDVVMGRISLVGSGNVLTVEGGGNIALWALEDGHASRSYQLATGVVEITEWEGGYEVSRVVASSEMRSNIIEVRNVAVVSPSIRYADRRTTATSRGRQKVAADPSCSSAQHRQPSRSAVITGQPPVRGTSPGRRLYR